MKKILAFVLLVMSLMTFTACVSDKEDVAVTQTQVEYVLTVNTETTGEIKSDVSMDEKKITLGDKEYEFPVLIADLIDDGWYFDENARERLQEMEGGALASGDEAELQDMNLYHDEYGVRLMLLMVRNETDTEQLLRDCYLTKFGLNNSMMEDPAKVNVVLPGGITWHSTAADVVSVYGDAENNTSFYQVVHNGSTADYFGKLFSVNFTFFEDGTIEYICFY